MNNKLWLAWVLGILAFGTCSVHGGNVSYHTCPNPVPNPTTTQFWLDFASIYSFVTYILPTTAEVNLGTVIYSLVKDPIHAEYSVSSTLSQNITLNEMKDLIKATYQAKLLPKGEYEFQLALLDDTTTEPNFLNVIREHVLLTSGGEIVYGITGFQQLSRRTGVRGTVLSAFRKFKLNTPLSRGGLRYSQSTDCVMFGTFCKINVTQFGNLGQILIPHILTYMRAQTLAQFKTEFQEVFTQMEVKSYEVLGDLPKEIRNGVAVVVAADGVRPDQIPGAVQFQGQNYNL